MPFQLFTEVDWLAVLAAAVVGFLIGAVWYGPAFGRAWAEARGVPEGETGTGINPRVTSALALIANLISAVALGHLVASYQAYALWQAVLLGLGVAVGIVLPTMGTNYLFSRIPTTLFAIDAGYWTVTYVVMGAIFAAIHMAA